MQSKKLGILYIILAAFFFAAMSLFIRLAGDVPAMQKAFFRNAIALIIAAAALKKEGKKIEIKRGNLIYLVMRAVCGTVGIICNYYAIDHLSLSDASMLNKMAPFFAVIISFLILKEKISPFQIFALITAFTGTLFIVRPSAELLSSPASLIGLLGGLGAGTAYTCVRILGQKGENKSFIVFFFSAFSTLIFLPFILFDYHEMNLKQFICLIFAGITAAGGQFSVTAAYCYAPAKEISVYDYSQILFAAIFGFFAFGQIPDLLSLTGYAIIISAAVAMFLYNNSNSAEETGK